jgi:ABC-type lipoprotein release transport system permease subunit
MLVRRAIPLVLVGLAAGVPIAIWTNGYATRLLGAIAARQIDMPVTLPAGAAGPLVAAAAAMIIVALAAAYLPARRASRLDSHCGRSK